jgi:hypothetical protein
MRPYLKNTRHIYSQLIFDKGVQHTRWRKDSLFNKCCWENWISTCRRLKPDPCLSPCTKINSKWIKDLNIRPKTLKQLQEAVGNTLEQIGIGNDFLNRTQKAQHLKETMNKWDCIKLLLHSKGNSHQTHWTAHRMGEKLASYSFDKGLMSRIYRDLKKTSAPSKNQHPNEEMGT